jgi:hypothetical protein
MNREETWMQSRVRLVTEVDSSLLLCRKMAALGCELGVRCYIIQWR